MPAPHTRLAPSGRATRTGSGARRCRATIGRTAALTIPMLLLLTVPPWFIGRDERLVRRGDPDDYLASVAVDAATDPPAIDAPVTGVVLAATGIAPAVPWLVAAAALASLYAGHRLLPGPPWFRRADRPEGEAAPGGSLSRTWYGATLALIGLAALAVAVGGRLGWPVPALAVAMSLAAVVAGATFLPALLTMPGPARGPWLQVRLVLDGVIVGLCLLFGGWVLMASPPWRLESPAFWMVMFLCCVMSIAILAGGSRGSGGRGRRLCAGGVCAAMGGLLVLSFALASAAPWWWLGLSMSLLVVAPPLIVYGAAVAVGHRAPALPGRRSPALANRTAAFAGSSPNRTSNQVIAVPAALALAVALQRLLTGGELDRAAMMLGTLAVVAVGLRHLVPGREFSGPPAGAPMRTGRLAGAWPAPQAPPDRRPRVDDTVGRETAYPEAVTGLTDRARVSRSIVAMRGVARSPGALLLIGIDGVETVTDYARDDALREVARRLRRFATPPDGERTSAVDRPARWSETEFALLTHANLAQAYGLAEQLVTLLAEPVPVAGATMRLSASVGLTDLAGAASTEDAINRAELALRRARQLGVGRVEWYDGAVPEALARRETLERELPDAVRRGELDLIYQPIMDLERGRPLAVEALLRWRHPQLGTLMPADVIPVAEETGAITDIDHWVLRRASAQLASWRREGRDLSMAINISPRLFRSTAFSDEVAGVLGAHNLPPDRLVCEVAESGLDDGPGLDECVAALRSIGVRTALDEFGMGSASLAQLRRLPIDMVKIGRSFFDDCQPGFVPVDRSPTPLIDVMVGVGRRLGIDVVAQGLEAPAQLDAVRTAGCRFGQGRLFARPLPAEHTEAYLDGFVAGRP